MEIRKITKEELIEARNISSIAFEWSHDTDDLIIEEYLSDTIENPTTREELHWDQKWAAFDQQGNMLSVLSIYQYEVYFDKNIYKMGGLAGICTYPQHRKKGASMACMKKALEEMYESGQIFSYLNGFSEIFYEKIGFKRSCDSIRWTFDIDMIPDYPYQDGEICLYKGEEEEDITPYEEVYKRFSKELNMMIVRNEFDWGELYKANPFKNTTMSFLYKDKNQVPRSYIIFTKEFEGSVPVMDCSELVFDSFEGLKAIMSFIKTFSPDYQKITFKAPRSYPLEYFCKDYELSDSTRTLDINGMIRVINVFEVLKAAQYKGAGSAYITIQDKDLIQNNKTFHVTFKENKGVSIEELVYDEINTDIVMTINEFSAAIVGNYDITYFDYTDEVTIIKNKTNLEKIFYIKPCWMNNFF